MLENKGIQNQVDLRFGSLLRQLGDKRALRGNPAPLDLYRAPNGNPVLFGDFLDKRQAGDPNNIFTNEYNNISLHNYTCIIIY